MSAAPCTLVTLAYGERIWIDEPLRVVEKALNDAGGEYAQHFARFVDARGKRVSLNAWQVLCLQEVPRVGVK